MSKKPTISTVPQITTNTTTINNNFSAVRDAFENTISRDGSTPNTMEADFDLNSNDILNAGTVYADDISVDGVSLGASIASTSAAVTAAEAAQGAAEAAAESASAQRNFTSRATLKSTWDGLSAGEKAAVPNGTIWTWPEASVVRDDSVTAISDLSGWKPVGEHIPVGAFASVLEALQSGYPLDWGDATYSISTAIDETLPDRIDWISNGAIIRWGGGAQTRHFFKVVVPDDGGLSNIEGPITFDGNELSHQSIRIESAVGAGTAADDYPSLYAQGLRAINARRIDTDFVDGDGIFVVGGFDRVVLEGPFVKDCKMATGAEVFEAQGIFGITVAENSGYWTKHIEINSPHIENIWSEDATYQEDQDGIRIFQDMDDPDATCIIRDYLGKNITNRFIKLHSAPNAVIDGWHFEKTSTVVPQSGAISSAAIEAQQAPATIINGRFHFDGIWNDEVVRNHTDQGDYRYGGSITSGISGLIENAASSDIIPVFLTSVADGTTTFPDSKFIATVSDISINGPVECFISCNIKGTGQANIISASNLVGEVTDYAFSSSGSSGTLTVVASNIQNNGSDVPLGNGFGTGSRTLHVQNFSGFTVTGATTYAGADVGLLLNGPLSSQDISFGRMGRAVWGQVIPTIAGVGDSDILILLGDTTASQSHAAGRVDLIRGTATSYGTATINFALQRDSGTNAASFFCRHDGPVRRDVSLVTCTYSGNTRYAIRVETTGGGFNVSEGAFHGTYFCGSSLDMEIVAADDVTGITAFSQVSGYEPTSDFLQPVRLPSYTVAGLPSASDFERCEIWVSDETGGAQPAYSDGTNWRRYSDGAIVS